MITNSQTKCGIIYEKIAMRADDERMIDYEWTNEGISLQGVSFVYEYEGLQRE